MFFQSYFLTDDLSLGEESNLALMFEREVFLLFLSSFSSSSSELESEGGSCFLPSIFFNIFKAANLNCWQCVMCASYLKELKLTSMCKATEILGYRLLSHWCYMCIKLSFIFPFESLSIAVCSRSF